MRITTLAAALVTAALVSPLQAEEARQNFTIVNKTGYVLSELYVSPNKANDWEEDVLGSDVLGDGENRNIRFNRRTRTCMWDIKVVYSDDDSSAVWKNINLCAVSTITLHYNRKSEKTTATFD